MQQGLHDLENEASSVSDAGVRRVIAAVLLAAVHAMSAHHHQQQQHQQQQQQQQPHTLPHAAWLRLSMQVVSWCAQLLLAAPLQQQTQLLSAIIIEAAVQANSHRNADSEGRAACSCPLCTVLHSQQTEAQPAVLAGVANNAQQPSRGGASTSHARSSQQPEQESATLPVVVALMQVRL